MRSSVFRCVCGLLVVGIASAAAGAAVVLRPCPVGCGGNNIHFPIDTGEAEYTCCTPGGLCKVCDDCPWYLELWC